MKYKKITNLTTLLVWNALGRPSLEISIELDGQYSGSSLIETGISIGSKEQYAPQKKLIQLIDKQFFIGQLFSTYQEFDIWLDELPFANLSNLTSALSLAFVKALANYHHQPLWKFLGQFHEKQQNSYPIPMICMISGGAHGDYAVDFQQIMIIPQRKNTFSEVITMTSIVFQNLKNILFKRLQWGGHGIGGYLIRVRDIESAFESVIAAVKASGFSLEKDFHIGVDVAATTLWEENTYKLPHMQKVMSTTEFIQFQVDLANKFSIKFLEDPLHENDFEGFKELRSRLPQSTVIIGDDICSSKTEYIQRAHCLGSCNGFIIKPSQAGSVSNIRNCLNLTKELKSLPILAGRSGDSEFADLMDIAWAWNFPYIKVGSFFGAQNTSKYNQGLRIEHQLEILKNEGKNATYTAERRPAMQNAHNNNHRAVWD